MARKSTRARTAKKRVRPRHGLVKSFLMCDSPSYLFGHPRAHGGKERYNRQTKNVYPCSFCPLGPFFVPSHAHFRPCHIIAPHASGICQNRARLCH